MEAIFSKSGNETETAEPNNSAYFKVRKDEMVDLKEKKTKTKKNENRLTILTCFTCQYI